MREKGNYLISSIAKDFPKSIYTDKDRLHQVLRHLVSNSCKFSEPGSRVHLRFSQKPMDQNAANKQSEKQEAVLVLEVSDRGIGMSDEELKTVLDPFVQADPTVRRRHGGMGAYSTHI